MRLPIVAKAAPVAIVLGLSTLLLFHRSVEQVTATLFSPTQSEQGITVKANIDSIVLCTGSGAFPVTVGALSKDTSTKFWVYEYTGHEPPNNGAYYVSTAQYAADPTTAQGPALTHMTRGKMYYVKSDHDLHFQCGKGFSEVGEVMTQSSENSSSSSSASANNLAPANATDANKICTPQECGPPLGVPSRICPDGSVAGPVCMRDATGKCGYIVIQCPIGASNASTSAPLREPPASAPTCQTITCSYTLKPGCQYVPGVSQNDCPVCGTVSCKGSTETSSETAPQISAENTSETASITTQTQSAGSSCVSVDCAAPPPHCSYKNLVVKNGCTISCGPLTCSSSSESTSESNSCESVDCAAPPPGCHYADPVTVNGCLTSCGTLACNPPLPITTTPAKPSLSAPLSCSLPADYVANETTYGERFMRQQTSDGRYFVYTVETTNLQGITNGQYTNSLKVFDKQTCTDNPLGDSAHITTGFDEPSIADNGNILDVVYQLDPSTQSIRIFHSIFILDTNGNIVSTVAQQIGVNPRQLNDRTWPDTAYSNTDAMISKDGSKVVFEAFGADLNTDPTGFQNTTHSTQVYVWQNGIVKQITNYIAPDNTNSANDPRDWDARFEDDSGRFISMYLGFDPSTGNSFGTMMPNGANGAAVPVYKLYLYDMQTKLFYKISDDINPLSHAPYQNLINQTIETLGGQIDASGRQTSANPAPQTTQQIQTPVSNNASACSTDADCPTEQCYSCDPSTQSCIPVCVQYSCRSNMCVKQILFGAVKP